MLYDELFVGKLYRFRKLRKNDKNSKTRVKKDSCGETELGGKPQGRGFDPLSFPTFSMSSR